MSVELSQSISLLCFEISWPSTSGLHKEMMNACAYDEEVRNVTKNLHRVSSSVTSDAILRDILSQLREYIQGDNNDHDKVLTLLENTPSNVSKHHDFMALIDELGKKLLDIGDILEFVDKSMKLTTKGRILQLLSKMHAGATNHPTVMFFNLLTAATSCETLVAKLKTNGTTADAIASHPDTKAVTKLLDLTVVRSVAPLI